MSFYRIFDGNLAIGESALEMGDPPMGIVVGGFLPFKSFDNFRRSKTPISGEPLMDNDQYRWEGLNVKTADGVIVPCLRGVVINTFGPIDEPVVMEVTCIGIEAELYQALFPHHVEAYSNSF